MDLNSIKFIYALERIGDDKYDVMVQYLKRFGDTMSPISWHGLLAGYKCLQKSLRRCRLSLCHAVGNGGYPRLQAATVATYRHILQLSAVLMGRNLCWVQRAASFIITTIQLKQTTCFGRLEGTLVFLYDTFFGNTSLGLAVLFENSNPESCLRVCLYSPSL